MPYLILASDGGRFEFNTREEAQAGMLSLLEDNPASSLSLWKAVPFKTSVTVEIKEDGITGVAIGESSKGRTADLDSANGGSTPPSPATCCAPDCTSPAVQHGICCEMHSSAHATVQAEWYLKRGKPKRPKAARNAPPKETPATSEASHD